MKKKCKKYKPLNTILVSVDTIVINGAILFSITLSITGIGLIRLLNSAGFACTLSLSNKVLHKMFINKYDKYKKPYERVQQTKKFLDKFFKKTLQDKVCDEKDSELLCEIFTKYVDETKNEYFFELDYKNKSKFFLVIMN